MTPRATLRLQFTAGFTFDDAIAHIPYWERLGISHLYASPIFKARPGSAHGYDTVDFTTVSPALGGEDGFRRLSGALRGQGMGLIVDIVPNHMAADLTQNAWWRDVLTHGRDSAFADYFDIDWAAQRGRLLLPILGKPLRAALADGELQLAQGDGGAPHVAYGELKIPLRPDTSGGDVAAVLERQHYRLAWWQTANDEINYRRFFDITELAALRMERRPVFEAVHEALFRLAGEGLIDGVRVDHVDGLVDPGAYCRLLRQRLDRALGRPAYLVVEKILGRTEALPSGWATDGTTGYDFMAKVGALLHHPGGEERLTALWRQFSGQNQSYAEVAAEARALILANNLGSEHERAALALHALAADDPAGGDVGLAACRRVVAALAVSWPVYRTYLQSGETEPADAAVAHRAFAAARGRLPPQQHAFLDTVLGWFLSPPPGLSPRLRRQALVRFQQLTAPLAAKAEEDTGFYRYGRLLSANEVGSEPGHMSLSTEDFHAACRARAANFPLAMLATATHDHKRGEDARARLAVLSEVPAAWAEQVRRWQDEHAAWRADGAPDGADELTLYQTLVGAWPPGVLQPPPDLAERVAAWQVKALREAKRHSNWVAPDTGYEAACRRFLERILSRPEFVADLAAFVGRISPAAVVNSLAQVVLRNTCPGVPDLYQGREFWDFSLVDPDNRAPVDFHAHRIALEAGTAPADLLANWMDGRVKQAVLARCLGLRRRLPALFAKGSYAPLTLSGACAGQALAFRREAGGAALVVVVTRLAADLLGTPLPLVPEGVWRDTAVDLPAWPTGTQANDVLTGEAVAGGETLPLARLLARLPVAVIAAMPAE